MKFFGIGKRELGVLNSLIGKKLLRVEMENWIDELRPYTSSAAFVTEKGTVWMWPEMKDFYIREHDEYTKGVFHLSKKGNGAGFKPHGYSPIPLPQGKIVGIGRIQTEMDVDNPRLGNWIRWDNGLFLVTDTASLLIVVSYIMMDWRIDMPEMMNFEMHKHWSPKEDQEFTMFCKDISTGEEDMIGRYVIRYSEQPASKLGHEASFREHWDEHMQQLGATPEELLERGTLLSEIAERMRRRG